MLGFHVFQGTPTSLAYTCLGGFIVTFSAFSFLIREKVYVNEVVLGTAFGILMGPLCAGIFDPRSWTHDTNRVTLEITRIVLATGLFAIGVELPKAYMYRHAKGLLAMVVPTMAIGWIIVAALLKALFSRFDFITCLALAACLTPTDPVISAAIIGIIVCIPVIRVSHSSHIRGGKFAKEHVPLNIRHILSAESAANDGLAYPFLSISLYLTLEPNRRKDFTDWILIGWLYEVILGTATGAVIGILFSRIMKFSHKRKFMDHESFIAQYFALTIFTMGVVNSIGSDDLLAAFAAGCAVAWDGDFSTHPEGEVFASVIEYILNCGCFFYIGAWLPWKDFNIPDLGVSPWKLAVLCIGILALRRIPALLTLYKWVPEIANWKEALFCGHFEPHSPAETQQDILATVLHPVVGFVVFISIIIHGLSIPFFNARKNLHHWQYTSTFTDALKTHTRTLVDNLRPPDWLLSVRRSPTDTPLPVHRPDTVPSYALPVAATTTDKIAENLVIPTVASASSSTASNRARIASAVDTGKDRRDASANSDTDEDSRLIDVRYGGDSPEPSTSGTDDSRVHIVSGQ
ncbi:hypothetical protein P691DRAFT_777670 [Macrolepiota fuliginosa MF-IS2]|uniref:Cation/H+ exchanger transmembrane domain-containing protein n=1 Tax=Macrolepiota fuliginosa MF-IS2 TaxID=1400762 RepID=A0A9P5X8H6_9AGAR|nr:hypothetical protein P691DRAFT_777670 [Macrolepiota fuliginosa MF-IS2]